MARYPGAEWRPLPDSLADINFRRGGCTPRLVVIHVMDGWLTGTDSHYRNLKTPAKTSAHLGTDPAGRVFQWLDTSDRAYAQKGGNGVAVSIENEGFSGGRLTAMQVTRCAEILAWANKVHGVPLQLTDDPNGRGLGWHGMGGAAWGNHPKCPGPPIIAQRPEILRQAKELVGASKLVVDGVLGPATVTALQKRLGVTADGVLGPETIKALTRRETIAMLQTVLNGKAI